MPSDDLHLRRHSVRLQGYDYSQPGAYFVTLVTHARTSIFGKIQGESIVLSRVGEIVQIVWEMLPNYFPIRLDESGIMPNHFHGIIVIEDPQFKIYADSRTRGSMDESAGLCRGESGGNGVNCGKRGSFPPDSPLRPNHISHGSTQIPTGAGRPAGTAPGSLGAIIQKFKAMTTHRINALQNTPSGIVWRRNYYEHVIRNEKEWENIRL
jgi:putative transposase